MAIYEYYCEDCKFKFEQLTSSTDQDAGRCPKCNKKNTKKLFSVFARTGQAAAETPCGGSCPSGGGGGCPFSGACGGH